MSLVNIIIIEEYSPLNSSIKPMSNNLFKLELKIAAPH
jgi:hypothetical protein